ncbi:MULTISPECIES: AIPR family protein [Aeromonas]|uniref:AIPR family protein n=1 Tax=Aeromonas TaxID=642 RepID=UPI0009B89508|nr:AIPR family protein [Aeromonas caviae]
MSKFIVQQITGKVKDVFASSIDISDLNQTKDKGFEDKLISRCLAAFAIHNIGGASISEAGKAVTDGGDDNGLDAIFFNKSTKRLTIVQSKYIKDGSSEPSADELRAFRDGIHDLLDGKLDKFNSKVREKKDEISAISQFGTKCDIVLIYTGKSELAKHGSEILSSLLQGLNGEDASDDTPVFKIHKLSKDVIFESLSKNERTRSVNLTFHLKEWGKVETPFKAFYGRIYGSKIGEWWEDHEDNLLQDNIRKMLGDTEVNQNIAQTAELNPEHFWYFNNGVTILAETVEKSTENRDNRDFGYFSATNASVVNGAQTVSVLGRLAKKGVDLSKLEVPVRIISLAGQEGSIKKDITRTNNTQNTILSKDFIAQDPVQESLQKQMSLLGYEYQIKRDDSFISNEKSFDLDEAIEALTILSLQSNYAAIFRKEVGRFYILDRSPYKSLFNSSISGYRVVNAINFKRQTSSILKDLNLSLPLDQNIGRKSQIYSNGSVLVSQLILEAYKAGDKINSEIIEWDNSLLRDYAISISEGIYSHCERNYPNSYLRTLFQNTTKCEDLYKNSQTTVQYK